MGGRGSESNLSKGIETKENTVSAKTRSFLSSKSRISDSVFDEIDNHMGRQYKRDYAESLAEEGTNSIMFGDMMDYVARNNKVTLPKPENRPYRDVIKDAIGSQAFQQLDTGLREGAQRWLNENPRRRRSRNRG